MAKRLPKIPGRATTDRAKGLVFEKILRAWKLVPEMRLGQFIDTMMVNPLRSDGGDLFYIEDETLAELLVEWAKDYSGVTVKKAPK